MIDFLKTSYESFISNITNINIILFILSLIVFFLIKTFSRVLNKSKVFLILFNLPGTFFHEMAHFFIGLITFGKPVNFSMIPKIKDNSINLGSVSFVNLNFFNTLPIALAPYLLLLLSIILFFSFSNILIQTKDINYYFIVYAFIVYSTLISSLPSKQDWYVAFSNKVGLIFYLVLFYFIIFNFDIIKSYF